MYENRTLEKLVGKNVAGIKMDSEKTYLSFVLEDGSEILYQAAGDCCSSSWIEHASGIAALQGGTVVSAESVEPKFEDEDGEDYDNYIKYHAYRVTTNKGWFEVDFRNSSNGYYDGSLVLVDERSLAYRTERGWMPELRLVAKDF